MKNRSLIILTALCGILALLTTLSRAQTPAIPDIVQPGVPFSLNGQTFLITTNADGQTVILTSGPAGTNSVTPPTNTSELLEQVRQMVANNNPANISYYGTNEWVLSVGGAFAQNSGQAAAELGIEKYGLLKKLPQIGVGASLLQGNSGGKSGTAGAYAFADYRKPIGDVAFSGGLGGGYDVYNGSPMGVVKAEIEYRQNAHLGEYVRAGYAFEGGKNDRGLIIGGGVKYAFRQAY